MLLFLASLIGHWLTGVRFENEQLMEHGQEPINALAFLKDAQFLSTVFENWESEFLQMATYVILTAVLFQRGSAESKDPDAKLRDASVNKKAQRSDAPAALRRGPLIRVLLCTFPWTVAARIIHSILRPALVLQCEAGSGGSRPTRWPRCAPIGLPFQSPALVGDSFQNWQSEFLSAAVLVVLSIWLRQKNSPESKPVTAPHSRTGA